MKQESIKKEYAPAQPIPSANLNEEKINNGWPQSVIQLAGAWKDFPTAEEIRGSKGIEKKKRWIEDF